VRDFRYIHRPVTTRRPPAPPPPSESTALIDRPFFEDEDDQPSDRDATDPNQRALPPPVGSAHEAPTGRFDFDDLDAMPSAHVSEFDVSDLDGEVHESGAPTTIMQLPPSMMSIASDAADVAPHVDTSFEEVTSGEESAEAVALMKWRAGGRVPPEVSAPLAVALATVREATRPDDEGLAATMPALSLDAVRQAAIAAGIDPVGVVPASIDTRGDDSFGGAVESALAAVLAAQSVADGGSVPPALHDHLARAVELLSALLDRVDRGDV